MKTKFIVSAISASLILLLASCMSDYDGRNAVPIISSESSYIQLPTATPYPTSTPGVSERAIQKYARSEVLTSSAHGIEISATNFRVDENMIKMDVCYQYPDNKDWTVYNSVLQIQNNSIPLLGSMGIELTETLNPSQKKLTVFPTPNSGTYKPFWQNIASDGSPDYRCDTLSFLLSLNLSFPSHFKLVIKELYAIPNEGEGCYEYREAVQHILDVKDSGIKIDCEKSDYKFSAGSRSIVVKKPDSMEQEEAKREVWHAYQEYHTFIGPWVFEGELTNTTNP